MASWCTSTQMKMKKRPPTKGNRAKAAWKESLPSLRTVKWRIYDTI